MRPVTRAATDPAARQRARAVLTILVFAALSFALARGARAAGGGGDAPPGLPLDAIHTVGAPVTVGGLTAFPIYASEQEDLGAFVSLPAALASGAAEVREVGAEDAPRPEPAQARRADESPSTLDVLGRLVDGSLFRGDPSPPPAVDERSFVPPPNRAEPQAVQRRDRRREPLVQMANGAGGPAQGGGATVNTLVIENKGDVPILVLAGTVVKGGRQDRQIGQDFVVQAGETVPVDAFCVEHGRWAGTRDGKATGGKFVATTTLAQAKVRSAGQYEKDQSKVWRKVAEVNAEHGKEADTGTLLATLDSDDVRAKQEELVREITRGLAAAPRTGDVVGLAWASGGAIRGVRWFASHDVYATFAPTLLETAAAEGVAAKEAAALAPKDVQAFVKAFEAAKEAEVRDAGSGNVNAYYRTEEGYKSETRLKGKPAKLPLSVDML